MKSRKLIGGLAIGLVLFFVLFILACTFLFGVVVGTHRAGWPGPWRSHLWEQPLGPRWFGGHGALGVVEKVEGDAITISGRGGESRVIMVVEETVIERHRERITLEDIEVGDHLIAIGSPDDEGWIIARVIRVFAEAKR